jgi:hypothetical protein
MREFWNKTVVVISTLPLFENCYQNHLLWNCVWNQFLVVSTAQYFHLTSSVHMVALCVGCHGGFDEKEILTHTEINLM